MKDERPVKRLCSEIQLFDICAEETCGDREGKFCTRAEILRRFEAIVAEEDARPPEQFAAEEDEQDEEDDFGYDERFEYEDEDVED